MAGYTCAAHTAHVGKVTRVLKDMISGTCACVLKVETEVSVADEVKLVFGFLYTVFINIASAAIFNHKQ